MILEIITGQKTGKKIQEYFNKIEQINPNTTLRLGDITEYVGYTRVQIEFMEDKQQHNLIDMFWLGYYIGFDIASLIK